ncbi:hypothetical protein [Aureimonas ureilytica]|uniref:hypothetical protein n=1 Tax=Aureimonas ureilytica TaxID=401562 RepID=UPI000A5618DF|nr:hypothetical protein [Aureimonas ureilytica]
MTQPLKIAKPPRTNTKGQSGPGEVVNLPNTQKAASTGTVQLPFQVPAEVRRAIKAYAAERDMTNSALFLMMWEQFRANNP